MLRGDFVGLCQVFRAADYPPLLAARLAAWLLEEAQPVERMYRRHLGLLRQLAITRGEPPETISDLDVELREPLFRGPILGDVDFQVLLNPETWDRCGSALIPIWSAVFLMIALAVDQWECVLLGVSPTNPDRLAGFNPEPEVCR